jgi:Protein of unknown function (DUF3040)
MRMPHRQRRMLRRMDRRLCRSDPHLAAMLAIFARLYGSEAISSTEQAPPVRVPGALMWVGSAAVWVVSGLAAGARRLVRHMAAACFTLRRRLSGDRRTTAAL